MNQSALILFLTLSLTSFAASFTPHSGSGRHHYKVASTELRENPSQSHQDIYDAIEAAALDAHDVSDAGMEAAMMERSVMIASELTDQMAQKAVLLDDNTPVVSEETIIEAYDDYVDHTMHFEKGLVDSSKKDIVDGHSTVAAFAHLIEESDE